MTLKTKRPFLKIIILISISFILSKPVFAKDKDIEYRIACVPIELSKFCNHKLSYMCDVPELIKDAINEAIADFWEQHREKTRRILIRYKHRSMTVKSCRPNNINHINEFYKDIMIDDDKIKKFMLEYKNEKGKLCSINFLIGWTIYDIKDNINEGEILGKLKCRIYFIDQVCGDDNIIESNFLSKSIWIGNMSPSKKNKAKYLNLIDIDELEGAVQNSVTALLNYFANVLETSE
ncbi:hypothetical protein GMMP15_1130003 [Candidatus Magnetomoraceae bacterium gMMP-15]